MWSFRDKSLPPDQTAIMGILNLTPDSFFDGGRYAVPEAAERRARELLDAGADLLDLGACSTRPGARPVSADEEASRLLPALRRIRALTDRPLSVDTTSPEVARAALEAGADILNDVSGDLASPLLPLAAQAGAGLVLMHAGGGADDRADDDPLPAVQAFFIQALRAAAEAGLPAGHLCLDPGIGFGKSEAGDRQLIARLPELVRAVPDTPLLVGASRKRVTGASLPPEQRLPATLALHTLAQWGGAAVLRVHDVREAVAAAQITDYLIKSRKNP